MHRATKKTLNKSKRLFRLRFFLQIMNGWILGITLYNLTHFTTCFGNLSVMYQCFISSKISMRVLISWFLRADLDYTSTTVKPLLMKNSEGEHLQFWTRFLSNGDIFAGNASPIGDHLPTLNLSIFFTVPIAIKPLLNEHTWVFSLFPLHHF